MRPIAIKRSIVRRIFRDLGGAVLLATQNSRMRSGMVSVFKFKAGASVGVLSMVPHCGAAARGVNRVTS
jgi:hypothetical protein